MNAREVYQELVRWSRTLFTIDSIDSLVSWDQEVNMPPKGIQQRTEMLSYLAQLAHQKRTDPHIGDLLAATEGGDWSVEEAANIREWKRIYWRATKLPEELVIRRARLTSEAHEIWKKARREDRFVAFAPALNELIEISTEVADYLGWEKERYDALLDDYDPGLTTVQCETLFKGLRDALVPLLQRIVASPKKANEHLFKGASFAPEKQRELGLAMSGALGFDYQAGRLDVSTHPFESSIGRGDVRITTRYDEKMPFQALMAIIHEAGHGIYEQGLRAEHEGLPMGSSVSFSIHESQSRFFENNVGRSRPFWSYWFTPFKETFGAAVKGVAFDDFYRLLNRVTPSLIRVEADEVTYNLHIIVRFEIERDLFRGDIKADDLPAVWNAKYKAYLGLDVPNDRQGVLQDIHWSGASFGYFPTYALGTVYAAQLGAALRRDVPDLDEQMSAGQFDTPRRWMNQHVHRYGMFYRSADLIEQATGTPPSTDDYVTYLTNKYQAIYG